MSREFGDYCGGYFHTKIENAAADALGGREPITRLWGDLLRELQPIAWAIASEEEGDVGPGCAIGASLDGIGAVRARLDAIEKYLAPFKRVRDEAVRMAACERETSGS